MKIGDKILCIKDRINYNIKGNTYTILDIKNSDVMVTIENNIYHLQAHYSTYTGTSVWSLSEHFDIIKIQRKEKLEKLNETNL